MTHLPTAKSMVALNQENSSAFKSPQFNLNFCVSEFACGFHHESNSGLCYLQTTQSHAIKRLYVIQLIIDTNKNTQGPWHLIYCHNNVGNNQNGETHFVVWALDWLRITFYVAPVKGRWDHAFHVAKKNIVQNSV